MNARTVFLDHDCHKRTDKSFRDKADLSHHRNFTVLENLTGVDMINSFPIDVLHNVLLGVVKKMLDMFFCVKGMFGSNTKSLIDNLIEQATKKQPNDFHRNIRNIEKYTIFKGTELRHFLYYIGPFVLESSISKIHFKLFMSLHIALVILKTTDYCVKYNRIARSLLLNFVNEFEDEFGSHFISYNMHLLTHFPDECILHGPVDEFSAFKFESFIQELKSYVKSPNRPLEQIFNRYNEKLNTTGLKCKDINPKFIASRSFAQNKFSKMCVNDTILVCNGNDNFVQSKCKTKIVRIDHFEKEGSDFFVQGVEFTKTDDIYILPVKSSCIDEFKVQVNHVKPCRLIVKQILRKFYVIEVSETISHFLPLSFLH